MSKLDCENVSTIYNSIQEISGLMPNDIINIFKDIPNKPNVYYTEDIFLAELKKKCNHIKHTSTYWFHLTRIFSGEIFSRGILPLSMIIDDIWILLYNLAKSYISSSGWSNFQNKINDDNNYSKGSVLYRNKINSINNQQGPYGFLIFNVDCFNKSIFEWHYLKEGPEIIYHICDEFQNIYGYNLFEKYITSTKPCIVKYIWYDVNIIDIGYALSALYYVMSNQKLDKEQNPCFSTRGNIVPSENIEKIFYVDRNNKFHIL